MKRLTSEQIKTASTKDLVAYYNHFAGKSISKFSSRAAGEAQCLKYAATGKAYNPPVASASRSAAIAESWQDPEIRTERCQRTHITVDGVEYRSVAEAFRKLGLPMGVHIKIRMELKATGKLSYANHTFMIKED